MSYSQSNVTFAHTKKVIIKKDHCIPRCFYIESLKKLCIFIGKVLEPLLDIGIYVKYYRFLNISRKILPD